MVARHEFAFAACLLAASVSCNRDTTLSKNLVGTWEWNPREMLPPDKIIDVGNPTPDLEAIRLESDGRCVVIRTVPGYDTVVMGKPFHVPNYWFEYQGEWYVLKGTLTISASLAWGAEHESSGWYKSDASPSWGRDFKVTDHTTDRLRLQTLADYPRDLRRSSSLPQRPVLASGGRP